MKIVVPMAGRGARFGEAAEVPKPLHPVAGRPMVHWALQSLAGIPRSELIFVALAEHERAHGLASILREAGGAGELVLLDDVTEGQLCTVLAARDAIDSDEEVLVASCDTYVRSDLAGDIARRHPDCRGLISVARMPGDHWSFARTDESGRVLEVAEKIRISDWASTGLYHFSSGRELLEVADGMIARDERTRGEFYVIPVYQHLIEAGRQVGISPADEVWDMGTPERAAAFARHLDSAGDRRG